jgi:hypothetical protein
MVLMLLTLFIEHLRYNGRDRVSVRKIDNVAENGFGRGRQGASLVVVTPRSEVFPVGGIGVKGVFRVTIGNVGTRSGQEILNGSS